jgi:DNA-binding protein H-NS
MIRLEEMRQKALQVRTAREEEEEEKAARIEEKRAERSRWKRKMSQRNPRGQPVMKYRLFNLLGKIKNSV